MFKYPSLIIEWKVELAKLFLNAYYFYNKIVSQRLRIQLMVNESKTA